MKYNLVVLEKRNWKDYYYKYFRVKCVSNWKSHSVCIQQ